MGRRHCRPRSRSPRSRPRPGRSDCGHPRRGRARSACSPRTATRDYRWTRGCRRQPRLPRKAPTTATARRSWQREQGVWGIARPDPPCSTVGLELGAEGAPNSGSGQRRGGSGSPVADAVDGGQGGAGDRVSSPPTERTTGMGFHVHRVKDRGRRTAPRWCIRAPSEGVVAYALSVASESGGR